MSERLETSDVRPGASDDGALEVTLPANFLQERIASDLKANKNDGRVATRFPPEPNGYLHIGHAKSITINFGLAAEFKGTCNLRFDDTNPATEDPEFIEGIENDIRWLGFDWENRLFHASDYFQALYEYAVFLIKEGKAYVDSLSPDEIAEMRGNFYKPGQESPFRSRSVNENLELFERMKQGEFEEGQHVLRAKIDMQSPNMNMRDPVIFRIKKAPHPRTGNTWSIYPIYDYAHCISDALEGITHSICTLEFEDHRPLYDWILDQLPVPCHPQQIEFARLNLSYTVTSKRKLKTLVEEGHVRGWDDPRMPTLVGLRRRGVTPEAIRNFCTRVGVAKADNLVDMAVLEHCTREDLDRRAPRVMAVVRPLKVVLIDFPEGQVDWLEAPYHPRDPSFGSRKVPFTRELYIEQDDFMLEPPKKFFRLGPGREVRLRYGCLIRCVDVKRDPTTGEVLELQCTHDPDTFQGNPKDGRKVKGILHWVSASHSVPAEVRLYDRLFTVPDLGALPPGQDFRTVINSSSLIVSPARVELSLENAAPESHFQFERLGYFCADRHDSRPGSPVFNRIVALKDSYAKLGASGEQA